jgi:hypothetical protein
VRFTRANFSIVPPRHALRLTGFALACDIRP